MTTSVTFLCIGALVASLLLACARGAAVHQASWAPSQRFPRDTMTQNSRNELPQPPTTSATSEESLLFNVTISDNDARLLRQEMEAINDRLANQTRRLSFRCGNVRLTANVTKINQDPRDIPSYFYNVQCPTNCSADNAGAKKFEWVVVETIVYKKLDNDTHEYQYEAWRRSQTVSCSWEEKHISPIKSTHSPAVIQGHSHQ